MIIVSACLLIVFNSILIFQYSSYVFMNSSILREFFWTELPSLAVSMMLDILALLGGVQALARRSIVFAVFGSSVLITISLSSTTSFFALLARALTVGATISSYEVLFITIPVVVLVLSVASLIFLARSRREFS